MMFVCPSLIIATMRIIPTRTSSSLNDGVRAYNALTAASYSSRFIRANASRVASAIRRRENERQLATARM
jgi:hypothetical protein